MEHVESCHPNWESSGHQFAELSDPGTSSSIVQTRNDTRKAPAIPTASLNSSLVGVEASNSNIDGDYTGPADDEKLGGNVHSKKSWFSDMEESFMVNSEIDF